MLKEFSAKLRESIDKLTRLGSVGKEEVDELVRDIQRSLIAADVDIDLVFSLSETIKMRAMEKLPAGLTRKEHVIKVVYEELTRILGERKSDVSLQKKRILLAGLYGSGKTSTAAKLARFYQKKGLKPLLVCCDTVRPAAYEQLQQLAALIDADFYGEKGNKGPSDVLRNALKKPGDVIIVDSSGRNALDSDLIREIRNLNDILKPDEKILVLPADIGQAAKQQSQAFNEALGITDIIVTKLDATAKGGGALTACYQTGARVKFITTGETVEDLSAYDPQKFVARLIGFPDLETLLEKAKAAMDEKKAEKIIKGDFDLEDFYSQIEGMQKMGPLSGVLDMMGLGKLGAKVPGGIDAQSGKMTRWKYVMQSMSKEEKANPDVLNSSRIRRIAKGSGTNESDVRELLASYNKIKKMVKKIKPERLKRGGFGGMLQGFGIK